jgi:cysteinyl-tRNA synthetase
VNGIKIYDSLTRALVDFQPRDPGKVSVYACGLTPQAPAHLGHMRGAVLFDVIRRWLKNQGLEVDFVQNFTDIDDKIIRRSQEEGVDAAEIARKYGERYLKDLALLGIEPARWVYVTKNMDAIIEMIAKIIANGHAYEVEGDVYFRVLSDPAYGKLSHRNLADMKEGARIEVDPRKEHPMDFALWKAAKPGEPSWDSPWGKGRPGWHIECSALSLKELGPNFDIHAGGVDLVFPHHENEIAQSEAYLGKAEFARVWMHWGSVQLAQRKMSKSEGNVLAVREAIERYSAGAVRLFLLNNSYRAPIDYTESRMAESQTAFTRIESSLGRVRQQLGEVADAPLDETLLDRFSSAMNNDFNTAAAIATLHDAVGMLNEMMAEGIGGHAERAATVYRTALRFSEILGLNLERSGQESEILDGLMAKVIKWRQELRSAKNFAMADTVRNDLAEVGLLLEDGVEGTTWRHK